MPYLHLDTQTLELRPGDTVVGSGAQVSWRLSALDLAPRHFTITVDGRGRARLCPISAQHVVVVDGRQVGVDGEELADGARIAAGSGRFVYTEQPGAVPLEGARSPRPEPALLVDDAARRAYPLDDGSVTIGRDRASTIVVRDPAVSRLHAEVTAEAGRHVVHSAGSAGTRVNGYRIAAPYVLEEGDRLEIGEVQLRYTLQPAPAGYTVAPVEDGVDEELSRSATVVHRRLDLPEGRRDAMGGLRVALLVGTALAVLVLGLLFAN